MIVGMSSFQLTSSCCFDVISWTAAACSYPSAYWGQALDLGCTLLRKVSFFVCPDTLSPGPRSLHPSHGDASLLRNAWIFLIACLFLRVLLFLKFFVEMFLRRNHRGNISCSCNQNVDRWNYSDVSHHLYPWYWSFEIFWSQFEQHGIWCFLEIF